MLMPQNSCLGDHMNLPPPDVSRRLPAELLASIFIRIARDSYIDGECSHCTPTAPSWANVSYVCRYWREVALNCPTFWSYIPPTSRCWTQELLARSQMVPLKISTKVVAGPSSLYSQGLHSELLSIVKQVMVHSQRMQKLCVDVGWINKESGYQIVSNFFSTCLPCLQHLDISQFELPKRESWLLLEENTPALHTLSLEYSSVPWQSLGSSVLTTLHLLCVGFYRNTMADFLAMLRRMPNLVHLSVKVSLPYNFLSDGQFDATPIISLLHLSSISITSAALSAATALLSCVDIPSRTKVELDVELEHSWTNKSFYNLDGCVRLGSLLAQRISQPDFPKLRSLTIGNLNTNRIALAFSTSERVECYSPDSLFSTGSNDNALLKVKFSASHQLDCSVVSSICSAIPLTNIQSVHFLGLPFRLDFWKEMLTSLLDVRHIRFSRDTMPNLTSMLFLPSHPLTRSWQDGRAKGDVESEIFLPALEELELYKSTLKSSNTWETYTADVQELYDAISTRKETRCRLTIKECRLLIVGGVVDSEALDSVGWWEGTEFRVTSNV